MIKLFKYSLTLFFLLFLNSSYANLALNAPSVITPFVTTWQTDGSLNVTIPLTGSGYDFTIDWGDGTIESKADPLSSVTHTYAVAGIKTVSITPNILTGFPRIYINGFSNSSLLKTIESWGSGQWGTSLNSSFLNASNLVINATDIPDFSNVTDMGYMFYGATAFNQDISNWNVSNVTNMGFMFYGATAFNQNIGSWNVSNVTDMTYMFYGATAFNQDISNWNVSNVNSMSNMFRSATAFNQNIGTWNVSNVGNMSSMFFGATAFNQNIGNWNVSNVYIMSSMFRSATAFNQNLAGWNISNVISLSGFLLSARLSRANYDALLVGWSTSYNGYRGVSASFGTSKYSNLPAITYARSSLTSNGWRITDGGIENDLTLPTITSSSLSSDNSAITVTFSEAVYPTFRGTGTLATNSFEFAITGGRATLLSTTPTSISTTDNLTFVLGIGLNGTANGSEVVTVKPIVSSIFDLAENESSTTQNNNTVQLNNLNPFVVSIVTKNGESTSPKATSVNKNGALNTTKGVTKNGEIINQ